MSKSLKCIAVAGAVLISFSLWLHPAGIASSATGSELSVILESGGAGSVYGQKCAECHGQDGRSRTFRGKHSHARDLTDAQWQDQVSDERIYNSIANGKGKMPGFHKKLSEAEINSLVTYVRNLKK